MGTIRGHSRRASKYLTRCVLCMDAKMWAQTAPGADVHIESPAHPESMTPSRFSPCERLFKATVLLLVRIVSTRRKSDGRPLNWLNSDLAKPGERVPGERPLDISEYRFLRTVLQNGGELRPAQHTHASNVP